MNDLLIKTLQDLVDSKDKQISLLEKEIERLKKDLLQSEKPLIIGPQYPQAPLAPWYNPQPILTPWRDPLTHPFVITSGPTCEHQWNSWGDNKVGGRTCTLCGIGTGWSSTDLSTTEFKLKPV